MSENGTSIYVLYNGGFAEDTFAITSFSFTEGEFKAIVNFSTHSKSTVPLALLDALLNNISIICAHEYEPLSGLSATKIKPQKIAWTFVKPLVKTNDVHIYGEIMRATALEKCHSPYIIASINDSLVFKSICEC